MALTFSASWKSTEEFDPCIVNTFMIPNEVSIWRSCYVLCLYHGCQNLTHILFAVNNSYKSKNSCSRRSVINLLSSSLQETFFNTFHYLNDLPWGVK
jgi:hypothetical protein